MTIAGDRIKIRARFAGAYFYLSRNGADDRKLDTTVPFITFRPDDRHLTLNVVVSLSVITRKIAHIF
jgi:hypothetical protein